MLCPRRGPGRGRSARVGGPSPGPLSGRGISPRATPTGPGRRFTRVSIRSSPAVGPAFGRGTSTNAPIRAS
eukprot:10661396-Alexandrium_andersonii.AAC.1